MTTRSPYFVGRQAELDKLTRWLTAPASKPILVAGLGGVGKTTLVARFVGTRYTGEEVAWLSFYNDPDAAKALDDLLRRIQRRRTEIVVLEDVDQADLDAVARFLSRVEYTFPTLPVILTSRGAIQTIDAERLWLSSFSTEEAVSLLQSRLGESTRPQLRELAKALGNYPLALELVSATARDRSIRDILSDLHDTSYELGRDAREPPQAVVEVTKPKIVSASNFLVDRLKKQPSDVHGLSSRQFEELVAQLLDNMGWEVHLTQQTRDGGRDILAYLDTDIGRVLCLVETKRYHPKRPVGIELVRTLYGTFHHEQANAAMLVTSSYFSPDAREFQKQHAYQLSLKDYRDVVEWIRRFKGAA